MDDFTKLKETEHMLQWFADEPYTAIRQVYQQADGTHLVEEFANSLKIVGQVRAQKLLSDSKFCQRTVKTSHSGSNQNQPV
jgi:hypothetical protein